MPIPPAASTFLLLRAQVTGHNWTMDMNVLQHLLNLCLVALATTLLPGSTQALLLPRKTWLPVGIELHGNDSGVVRPILEQHPLLFEQGSQLRLPIGMVAR